MDGKSTPHLIVPESNQQSLPSEIAPKRKKVPLRPGHSLADWIRLSKENPGIAKVTRPHADEPVTVEELSMHSTISDCWIALRGKAFNVTPYLDFHPGGADEIFRLAGKDATAAFDEVHTWVNYEGLLRACYIAPFSGRSLSHTSSHLVTQ